jgi:hypothetical protein
MEVRKVPMTASAHLRIDALTAYLADPEAATSADTGRHLSHCATCRRRLSVLSALNQSRPTIRPEGATATAMQTDAELRRLLRNQSIERYVQGRLGEEARIRVRNKLSEDQTALKAALHFARHSAAMERALSAPVAAAATTSPAQARQRRQGRRDAPSFLAAIKAWLNRRIPLWATMPTAALVAGALAFCLMWWYPPHQHRLEIALYRDTPMIQFRSPQQGPGVGFFNTAPAGQTLFSDVAVSLAGGGRLEIAWPPVPQATAYRIELSQIKDGVATVLEDRNTSDTRAVFEGLEIVPGQRYVWMLSGNTTDHRRFQAQGGFVCYQGAP